ncbi:MAG: TonB-dependent receptor [Candidatus Latescibacteria bacterium]|nr:TonB-dependent receptor [Candidatus Latescibacterota bacterium]
MPPTLSAMYRLLILLGCCLALICPVGAGAQTQTTDLFEFFAEEAQGVSASRIPLAAGQPPATVYVITAEELAASGALTLWDALRTVPGIDVMTVRTFQGSVSIRGLNKSLNSRTLLLVDGRSSMAVSVDYSFWENLPVLFEEIERIEVVEGPASALYGANALNGVINIVTKKPAQVGGGRVSYAIGERRTHTASLLYGRQQGRLGYKFGLGWRTGNSFENPDQRASETLKGSGSLSYDLGPHTQISLSGGRTGMDTEVSGARFNRVNTDGTVGYLRLDGVHDHTRLRLFWNTADMGVNFRVYELVSGERHDVWDLNLEQLIPLSARSTAVVGVGVRHTSLSSSYVSAHNSRWSAFAEHQWQPTAHWALWSSARLDAMPNTQAAFSPRLSLVFTPAPAQTLRLSAGVGYRNPTLLDSDLFFSDTLQIGDLQAAVVTRGNPDLDPEQIRSYELAYQLERGRYKALVTGFAYRLEQLIVGTASASGPDLNHLAVQFSSLNQGSLDAWGGEAGVEISLGRHTRGFANYSYQDLRGDQDPQAAGSGTPHHKANGGLRFQDRGLAASASWNWVARTLWRNNNPLYPTYQEVPGYTLFNFHLGYRLAGRWQDLELSLDAANAFDNRHYETLPAKSVLEPGQAAEVARSRRSLRLSYQF